MNVFITILQVIVWSCGLFTGISGLYNLYLGEDHVLPLFVALGCFLFIYIVMYYHIRFKYKNRMKKVLFCCHSFNHDLRDRLIKIENKSEMYKSDFDLLRQEIKEISQTSLDYLSDALSSYTGRNICVHYKHIPFEKSSQNIKEPTLMTLALCRNTRELGERHKVKKHLISDSVPYGDLYNDHVGHCYFPNFRRHNRRYKKLKGKDFIKKNDKVDKYYGSVAYVAVQRCLGDDNYDVRGILVADHKRLFVFLPISRDRVVVTELMKMFADGMYMLMVKFNQVEKLNQKKQRL